METKTDEPKKTKMLCTHCGYEWETLSKAKFVTCPSCMVKTEKE